MDLYDIAVIGAGPCGSVLSMLLAKQGYKIAVIDKRNLDCLPPTRSKACGGLLSPDAQRVLASLELNLPNNVLVDPQLFSVVTIDLETGLQRHYQRFYLNMDREKFDRYLVSLIPDNVVRLFSTMVKDISSDSSGYQIFTDDNKSLKTKIIIGCDGAGSIVRKKMFNDLKMNVKNYYAIQHVYEYSKYNSNYYAIFDKNLTDYSGWAFPKNGTFSIGMAFKQESEGNRFFDILIGKLEKKGMKLGKLIKKEGALLLRPSGIPKVYAKKDNTAFLAGEAAGYISPSSAEGFSFAFNSACALAEAFKKGGNISKNYCKLTLKLRIKLILKIIKARLMYNQYIRKIVMALRINTIR